MSDAILERRRELRVPMKDDERIGVPVGLTVRLVDISAGGVLLFSPQKLRLGQKARLRTTLGADPFNVDIEVRRIGDAGSAGAGRGGYRIGAVFSGVDDASSRSVRHFLSGDFQ
jgi:c-di-GMP-binding flagellar brake protein YcgR